MTEQEAIKEVKRWTNILMSAGCKCVSETAEAQDMAIKALEKIQKYHRMEERLKDVYGECDGLLETFIEQSVENAVSILENHDGVDIGHPYQSRLLTDEDVDKWEAYKAIGTPKECRAAVEKQKAKKPEPIDYKKYMDSVKNAEFLRGAYWCPNCNHVVRSGSYCGDCGQKLDWSDDD